MLFRSLIGEQGIDKLQQAKVLVFGVGGVGGFCVEALARSGVGELTIVDNDIVAESNINRQIIATWDTIGKSKVEVMKERIISINPDCNVNIRETFYLPENADLFHFEDYDYIVDAIDTVTAKIDIIVRAKVAGTRVISSMGAGNKLDPTKFVITDIYQTKVCPLAKVMRKELKNRKVKECKVVYSTEDALTPLTIEQEENKRRPTPGSIAFVPSVAGLIVAGEVIKDLMNAE